MKSFDKLWTWMNSWKQEEGYGGIIHHCIHGTMNLSWAKPTPSWTYTPISYGFADLYERTGEERWLKELEDAKSYLLGLQDTKGLLNHSSLEFTPESPGIIHNAYSALALLRIYEITKDKKILDAVKKILRSLIIFSWNGSYFSGTVNQDLTIAAAIAKYSSLSGDKRLFRFVLPVVEWAKGMKGDEKSKLLKGALIRGIFNNEDSYANPWYNSVMAECFLEIYKAIGNEEYLEEAKQRLDFTFSKYVKNKGLMHSVQKINGKWVLSDNIKLVLPLFLSLTVAEKMNEVSNFKYPKEIEGFLLKNQLKSGYFRNTVGYGIRDFIGTMPWDAYAFEFFARKNKPKLVRFEDSSYKVGDEQFKENKDRAVLDSKKYRVEWDKKTGKIDKKIIKSEGKLILDKKIHNFNPEMLNLYQVKPFFNLSFGFCDKDMNLVFPSAYKDTKLKLFYASRKLDYKVENSNIYINGFKNKPYHTKKALVYYKLANLFFPVVASKMVSGAKGFASRAIRK